MGAVAHLDHHEQLMQHDGRAQMVWSNREQEETNAYAATPESRQADSSTDMHKPAAVQFGVQTHRRQ